MCFEILLAANAMLASTLRLLIAMSSLSQAVEAESQELELDLSSLGAVNTVFAALFRFVSFEMDFCSFSKSPFM